MSLKFFRDPYAQRAVSVITGIALAGSLLLSACGGGSPTSSGMPQQSSGASTIAKLPPSGKAPVFKAAQMSGAKSVNRIGIAATSTPGTTTVQLQLPANVDAKSLAVTLNGKDVSSRFSTASCADGECMKATLSTGDGYAAKNVLSAHVRGSSGGMASGRARFAQATATATGPGATTGTAAATAATAPAGSASISAPMAQASVKSMAPKALAASVVGATTLAASTTVCDPTSMCPFWLPPSVSFNTLQPGGWDSSTGPWIQINGQAYPTIAAPASCAGAHYVVVVLDRQTLTEKTAAPESSPQCFADSPSINGYLGSLPSSDLVIAGSTSGQVADDNLDTTPIGGSAYSTGNPHQGPQEYMVIGAGQQRGGSAYENYDDNVGTDPQFKAFATGTLQEDANGNYNFQSSDGWFP